MKKTILYTLLGVALVLGGIFIYFWSNTLCCAPLNEAVIDSGDYADDYVNLGLPDNLNNLEVVYSMSTGSLPPPHYRREALTISTDARGVITAEYVVRDYEKVLERKDVVIPSDRLGALLDAASRITQKSEEDRDLPCSGASSRSVTISQDDEVVFGASAHSCGGAVDYASFSEFISEIDRLLNK